ncbi:hypothetical protein [Flavobacterium sp.]|uniref:hypothetical protein n=1 Tax=Flavobacterium sp. TaxID=239 RepID=UPI0026033E4D|nr:hypothetical protein [Flavobacterium sp.]
MKLLFYIACAFLAFTLPALAQEEQDNIQKQPPAITHRQVVMDERMAQNERKKHNENQSSKSEATRRKDKEKSSSDNTTSTGKTSSKPEKQ